MLYATIYAPTGEMFEVPEERAAELVLKGWTRSPTTTVPFTPAPPTRIIAVPDEDETPRRRRRIKRI